MKCFETLLKNGELLELPKPQKIDSECERLMSEIRPKPLLETSRKKGPPKIQLHRFRAVCFYFQSLGAPPVVGFGEESTKKRAQYAALMRVHASVYFAVLQLVAEQSSTNPKVIDSKAMISPVEGLEDLCKEDFEEIDRLYRTAVVKFGRKKVVHSLSSKNHKIENSNAGTEENSSIEVTEATTGNRLGNVSSQTNSANFQKNLKKPIPISFPYSDGNVGGVEGINDAIAVFDSGPIANQELRGNYWTEKLRSMFTNKPNSGDMPRDSFSIGLDVGPVSESRIRLSNQFCANFIQTIGKGQNYNSEVFQAELENIEKFPKIPTDKQIAIKRIRKDLLNDLNLEPIKGLLSYTHPNLVKYYYAELESRYFYFAMELAKCNLQQLLSNPEISLKYDTFVQLCKDCALGLEKLHSEDIVHNNITPQNVLIFFNEPTGGVLLSAKLSDIGFVKKRKRRRPEQTLLQEMGSKKMFFNSSSLESPKKEHFETKSKIRTNNFYSRMWKWSSPKAKKNERIQSTSDIFSLGLVFVYTMTSGKHLFRWNDHEKEIQVIQNIKCYKPNWKILEERRFTALKNLLQVMVTNDPEKRAEMRILLEHPFFWNTEESFEFILTCAKDLRNHGAFKTGVQSAAKHFLVGLNWKEFLNATSQSELAEREKILDAYEKLDLCVLGWRRYSGASILHLISFIQDQDAQYKKRNKTYLGSQELLGCKEIIPGPYFVHTFPKLTTLLYNVLQNPRCQSKRTNRYFLYNVIKAFKLQLDNYT